MRETESLGPMEVVHDRNKLKQELGKMVGRNVSVYFEGGMLSNGERGGKTTLGECTVMRVGMSGERCVFVRVKGPTGLQIDERLQRHARPSKSVPGDTTLLFRLDGEHLIYASPDRSMYIVKDKVMNPDVTLADIGGAATRAYSRRMVVQLIPETPQRKVGFLERFLGKGKK